MYELKIYRRIICYDNKEWCKIGGGIDLSFQNWHEEFDKFLPKHSKISEYIMFEQKNFRGVIFDGTEDWCKTLRKTDLCFLKWHEEFVKFFSQAEK